MTALKSTVSKKGGKQRNGKGFSGGELRAAGLNFKEALRLDVPVDLRRGTVHEGNVAALKVFLEGKKAAAKPVKKRKSKS